MIAPPAIVFDDVTKGIGSVIDIEQCCLSRFQ